MDFLILVYVFSGVSNPLSDLHIDTARRFISLKGLAGLVSGRATPLIGLKERAIVSQSSLKLRQPSRDTAGTS